MINILFYLFVAISMNLRLLCLAVLLTIITACSASKTQLPADDLSLDPGEGSDQLASAPPKRDSKANDSPANFDEYRQWRKQNDPSGQTYAEYKQWEAAYRQWLQEQAEAVR